MKNLIKEYSDSKTYSSCPIIRKSNYAFALMGISEPAITIANRIHSGDALVDYRRCVGPIQLTGGKVSTAIFDDEVDLLFSIDSVQVDFSSFRLSSTLCWMSVLEMEFILHIAGGRLAFEAERDMRLERAYLVRKYEGIKSGC